MARRQPDRHDALLEVKGIGPAKLRRYGGQLLEMLSGGAASAREVAIDPPPSEPPTSPPPPEQPEAVPKAARVDPAQPDPGEEVSEDADLPPESEAVQPSHYWTWRLLAAGFSASQCEAIRRLDRETILDHALRAIESGWPVRAESCVPEELMAAVERIDVPDESPQVRALLAQLPAGTRYEEVLLVLKCRGRA